ncbi:hypothetical protein FN846DRAFT_962742 [Sphaerosporella brunnea]|uniref:Uncharacterized protein n=1 Tax=Sphaerosporella brunnea TaxID=1250544 RepID=A0A5J5EP90_9PEZI|nr:hypothetical protein FN846DRAFT_962742 [Sphaerosporella brunnea]
MSTASAAPADVPMWKHKLLTMAAFYKDCHHEGNMDKFFEVYPAAQSLQAQVLALSDPSSPPEAMSVAEAPEPSGLPADTTEALKKVGGGMITEHQEGSDEMKGLTDQLKQDPKPNKDSWKDKINKKREELKKKSAQIIDEKTDSAIAVIEKLPESQRDTAADFWGNIASGFLKFWDTIWTWLQNVWQAVVQWFSEMWEKIKQGFQEVGKAFVSAWNWLKSLF